MAFVPSFSRSPSRADFLNSQKVLYPAAVCRILCFLLGNEACSVQVDNSREVSMKFAKPAFILASISAIVLWYLNVMYQPFLVTNPDDPRFDVKQFQFANYSIHIKTKVNLAKLC